MSIFGPERGRVIAHLTHSSALPVLCPLAVHAYNLRKSMMLIPGVASSWLVKVRPGVALVRVLFRW